MRGISGIIIASILAMCYASVSSDIQDAMSSLQAALLSKATVLSDERVRFLEGNDDDYYCNYGVDFYGFSLKYAKCQTVQRFSEDAIKNGEYSAMVKDDIVVLRLCPTNQCNSNREYGCHYNYVEYGIDIIDYVKIMLKYTVDKREKMCNFCQTCGYRRQRKLDEEEDERDEDEEDREEEDNEDEDDGEGEDDNDDNGGNGNNGNGQFDDDDYYVADDDDNYGGNNNDDDNAGNTCANYYDECQEIGNWCQGAADDDVGYLDFADYLDYLDCVKVEGVDNYGDAAYWIRPHCNSEKQTIKMDIFYDPYCSQYAGNDVNLREFSGIYFRQSVFQEFTDGQCIDCGENNYGPYYDSGHYMCNNLHKTGARCTDNLMNQIFDDDDDTSVACSFIGSIQSGTYNAKGEIYIDNNMRGEGYREEITTGQMAGLVISILLCVCLGVYSCYLHHSITNLLIKSLSHSHLLPPSRHRHRKSRFGRGSNKGDDDDWDHNVGK